MQERHMRLKEGCFGGNTMDAIERDIADAEGEGRLLWWKHHGCKGKTMEQTSREHLLRQGPFESGGVCGGHLVGQGWLVDFPPS